jgi:RND family efflux transporter MFP subunit
MIPGKWKAFFGVFLLLAAGAGVWFYYNSGQSENAGIKPADIPVPVEAAAIKQGQISLRRTFSGEIRSNAEFSVAPRVSGRIGRLTVDMADIVSRGQLVAQLDNDEYVQAVARAEAELEVVEANLAEARSALKTADRELERIETLRRRGVASESNLDAARAQQTEAAARVAVAEAQVTRALASAKTEKIRLGYTRVTADWNGGSEKRVVAERFVDEGDTVSANTPLVSIVELDPIIAVIFVTEKDYTRLKPGMPATLTTQAWPGRVFSGKIARIAPVFGQSTRQARVELLVENTDHSLKPGMFIRASVILRQVDDAVIVPEAAIIIRNDQPGVFVVDQDSEKALWQPVKVGILENGLIQVHGLDPAGMVVTLGQQLIDDRSLVVIRQSYQDTKALRDAGPLQ